MRDERRNSRVRRTASSSSNSSSSSSSHTMAQQREHIQHHEFSEIMLDTIPTSNTRVAQQTTTQDYMPPGAAMLSPSSACAASNIECDETSSLCSRTSARQTPSSMSRFWRRTMPSNTSFAKCAKPYWELFKLSIPCIFAQLLSYINHLVASLAAGRIDRDSLAAATVSVTFTNILGYSFIYGLSMALDTLATQQQGSDQINSMAEDTPTATATSLSSPVIIFQADPNSFHAKTSSRGEQPILLTEKKIFAPENTETATSSSPLLSSSVTEAQPNSGNPAIRPANKSPDCLISSSSENIEIESLATQQAASAQTQVDRHSDLQLIEREIDCKDGATSEMQGHVLRAAFANFFACVPIFAIWWHAKDLLLFARQDAKASETAGRYVRILATALPANVVTIVCTKQLQAMMLLKIPMLAQLSILPANLVCQFFLAYYAGVYGTAVGSVISDYTLAFLLLYYSFKHNLLPRTVPTAARALRESMRGWWRYIKLAVPSLFMMCADWWVYEIISLFAGTLGVKYLDAQSIILNSCLMVYMLHLGISVTASSRIGNCLGSNRPEDAAKAARVALSLSVITSIILSFLLVVLRNYWGYLFTNDAEVRSIVADLLPITAVYLLADGGCCVAGGVMRACGKQKVGACLMIVAYYVVGIPVAFALQVTLDFGLTGVLGTLAVTMWLNFAAHTYYTFYKLNWQAESDLLQRQTESPKTPYSSA